VSTLPNPADLTPAELKALVVDLLGRVRDLERQVAARDAEIARLKGLKGRPDIKPSGMEQATKDASPPAAGSRRGGGNKTARRTIHEERVIKAAAPPGSRFKGYQNFVVQDLVLRAHVLRLRRECWVAPDGQRITAALPAGMTDSAVRHFASAAAWTAHLEQLAIHGLQGSLAPARVATEGALWGSIAAHRMLRDAVIVSDDAGQFDVGRHALCWVHAERLVHRLDTFTDQQRAAQQQLRKLIWEFYADLKTYRAAPSPRRRSELRARFVRIFRRRTGFVVLDRLLARLLGRKAELLRVLERPEIPLHTNGSENDIRACVIKRKISGGTQSEAGRNCRDTFLGLAKTCAKLGVSFWDYLGHRLRVPGASIVPDLQNLVRTRAIA